MPRDSAVTATSTPVEAAPPRESTVARAIALLGEGPRG